MFQTTHKKMTRRNGPHRTGSGQRLTKRLVLPLEPDKRYCCGPDGGIIRPDPKGGQQCTAGPGTPRRSGFAYLSSSSEHYPADRTTACPIVAPPADDAPADDAPEALDAPETLDAPEALDAPATWPTSPIWPIVLRKVERLREYSEHNCVEHALCYGLLSAAALNCHCQWIDRTPNKTSAYTDESAHRHADFIPIGLHVDPGLTLSYLLAWLPTLYSKVQQRKNYFDRCFSAQSVELAANLAATAASAKAQMVLAKQRHSTTDDDHPAVKAAAAALATIEHAAKEKATKRRDDAIALEHEALLSTMNVTTMNDLHDDTPDDYDKLCGMHPVKAEFRHMEKQLVEPLYYGRKTRNVILFGPPGTGKTVICKIFAKRLNLKPNVHAHFFAPSMDALKSKWVGEGERKIHALFQCAQRRALRSEMDAAANAPDTNPIGLSFIFLDEIDALTPQRGGKDGGGTHTTTNQFLVEMDGFSKYDRVVVFAATNHIKKVDSAVVDRFSLCMYIDNEMSESDCECMFYNQLSDLFSRIVRDQMRSVVKHCLRKYGYDRHVKRANTIPSTIVESNPSFRPEELVSLFHVTAADMKKIVAKMVGNSPSELRNMFDRGYRASGLRAFGDNAWYNVRFEECSGPLHQLRSVLPTNAGISLRTIQGWLRESTTNDANDATNTIQSVGFLATPVSKGGRFPRIITLGGNARARRYAHVLSTGCFEEGASVKQSNEFLLYRRVRRRSDVGQSYTHLMVNVSPNSALARVRIPETTHGKTTWFGWIQSGASRNAGGSQSSSWFASNHHHVTVTVVNHFDHPTHDGDADGDADDNRTVRYFSMPFATTMRAEDRDKSSGRTDEKAVTAHFKTQQHLRKRHPFLIPYLENANVHVYALIENATIGDGRHTTAVKDPLSSSFQVTDQLELHSPTAAETMAELLLSENRTFVDAEMEARSILHETSPPTGSIECIDSSSQGLSSPSPPPPLYSFTVADTLDFKMKKTPYDKAAEQKFQKP